MALAIKRKFGKIKRYLSKETLLDIDDKQLHRFINLDHYTEEELTKLLEQECIGSDAVFEGPFGPRKVVYCDFTASGKSVSAIENFIRDKVLPFYGNVHTTTSVSSAKTTSLRKQAKQIIRDCVNASNDDVVLFVGSGLTGAINKLIHSLKFKTPPVVLISPYEHHSNILPWIEIGSEVVYITEDINGSINLTVLEDQLKKYQGTGRRIIGSFSSASNVTGVLTEVDAVATLLHEYGALAFFDYATAAPYVRIDINPESSESENNNNATNLAYKDAIFCSIHKFLGGPQTPGLLVCKRNLFTEIPYEPGGGTVKFVDHRSHVYVDDVEEREEGGTPSIVESIRAGLVFKLKQKITEEKILKREQVLANEGLRRLSKIENLHVLLSRGTEHRLPIFSFLVTHKHSKRYIHHNFVATLMNDLFGLQMRGGCSCAGPYSTELLGISSEVADSIKDVLQGVYTEKNGDFEKKYKGKTYEILKPGFVRFNLPFFFSREAINYIFQSVEFIAKHAWKFLPLYDMDPETGCFKKKGFLSSEGDSLSHFLTKDTHQERIQAPLTYQEALSKAEKLAKLTKILKKNSNVESHVTNDSFLSEHLDKQLRWFLLPSEAFQYLSSHITVSSNHTPLFTPRDVPDVSAPVKVYKKQKKELVYYY